jgi:putative Holliday junction resolvase
VPAPRTLALDVGDRRIGIAITDADGTPSPQSEKTQTFAAALREFLAPTHPELIFHLVDERLTTRDAHALLDELKAESKKIAGKSSRLARTETIDQVAAVLLLESFLSAGKPALLPEPDAA